MRLDCFKLVLVGVALIAAVSGQQLDVARPETQQQTSARTRFQLPKILDFQSYSRIFHKAYGQLEAIARRKYFLARALRAWTSSIKYKLRKSSYNLALNHLSDRSPEELKRRLNHQSSPDVDDLERKSHNHSDYHSRTKRDSQKPSLVSEKMEEVVWDTVATPEELSGQDDSTDWLSYEPSFFAGRDNPTLPDEIFVDHRDSGCMFLPRDQGNKCGSCYAFTTIAIAEWLYCKRTGKLVSFSEQYLIDCGGFVGGTGCAGGNHYKMARFVHAFGLELGANYPYRDRQDECPYEPNTRPKSMGRIRMELGTALMVPIKRLEDYIHFGPMYISISLTAAFYEYGGGVWDGLGCKAQGEHAVVLIGHGRQDGQEYWLIRNSDSVGWGEQGHIKLVKQSDCIHRRFGTLFGVRNGGQMFYEVRENHLNDPRIVQAHYKRNLSPSKSV